MASRSLGQISIDLVARIGGFTKGLTEAERASDKATRQIERQNRERAKAIQQVWNDATRYAITAFGALATAGVAAFAVLNRQANNIAGFQDLAEKIGDTAEAVASLKLASDTSEVSLDTVGAASIRLTASLSKTDDESKAVAQAIKALGLNFQDFKKLAPVDQLEAVSKAMNGFADGSEKTAVAVALFGKAGAELIPFLNDLSDGSERQIRLTSEQIKQADDYTKAQARLKSEFETFIQFQTAQAIPTMTAVQNVLAEIAKNETAVAVATDVVKAALGAAITVFQTLAIVGSDVGFVFLSVGREIGAWAAQLVALGSGDLAGFRAISEAVKEDGERARKELDKFQKSVMQIGQTPYMDDEIRRLRNRSAAANAPAVRPRINTSGLSTDSDKAGKDAAAALKKQLDLELAELQRAIDEQGKLLSERNKFLDLYNGLGLLSIEDYYQRQQNIRDEATQAQVKSYDAQIQALRDYQAKVAKGSERLEVQGKINDLLEKQSNLQREAGSAAIVAGLEQARAAKDYQASINDVNASILEMTGFLKEAAAIRFDKQIEGLAKSVDANGSSGDKAALDRYRQLTIAQAEFGDKAKDIAAINETLRMQEERVALSRQLGFDGEISSLGKLGAARKETVAQLEAIVQAQEAIARASENPVLVRNAEQARLALDQLAATVDPLAERFNTMFADSASNAFGDFIDGTKSAKEAFTDFINDIVSQLTSMIAKDLFKQLFSSGGSGGGGGFDIGGILSGLFGGGRAAGGAVTAGGMYRVNENGPEMLEMNGQNYLMMGNRGGNVSPNAGSSTVNNINVTMPAGATRQTGMQFGAEVARQIGRANSRNG